MTAPSRRQSNRLAALLRAADRVRDARDREARRHAEDALELAERRALRAGVVVAEAELLRCASVARVRCAR